MTVLYYMNTVPSSCDRPGAEVRSDRCWYDRCCGFAPGFGQPRSPGPPRQYIWSASLDKERKMRKEIMYERAREINCVTGAVVLLPGSVSRDLTVRLGNDGQVTAK